MINFYSAWKEDKELDSKPAPNKKAHRCKLCGKRINGLAHHVKHVHGGPDAWKRYIAAEQAAKDAAFIKAYENLL